MQPPQHNLRPSAAKDTGIAHAAAAARNLDAATPLQSADTGFQSAIGLRTTATQIAAPKRDLGAKAKNRRAILANF